LHKRGFRFVGDVDEDSSASAAGAGDQPPSTPAAAHEAAKLVPDAEPLPLPDKPSIAVLPFQNMSRDPDQEYFAAVSPKTSSRVCRGSDGSSSSPATRRSLTRARPSTSATWPRSWA